MAFALSDISISPLHFLLLAFLVMFVIAVLQASAAVLRYRRNFGDAPLPVIPSHGVVVVKNKSEAFKTMPKESLRLLLVGDSLACGVGQSVTCTPVMPEVISRELSRATGKAVYWTCHGESGASAGWIIRELEDGMNHDVNVDAEYGSCSCDGVEVNGTLANGNGDIEIWKERLDRYRRRFNPDELGPYDIVVVLTGTNDLKIMLCPCLIMEEDKELRRRYPGAGFIADLTALIQNINDRMKRGMRNISERATLMSRRIRGNTEEFGERGPNGSSTSFSDELSTDSDDDEREVLNGSDLNGVSEHAPLFVLPAMPIRTSPSIRHVPLRWLTIPFFDRMEAKKRKLAKANPGELLWVKDPSLREIIEYEEQRGTIWEHLTQQEVLLSLRYVKGGDCGGISAAMKEYYQNKSASFDTVNDPTALCDRPGRPGTKVYCADKIHPNEAGYQLWGQHIANAIVADMKKRRKHR